MSNKHIVYNSVKKKKEKRKKKERLMLGFKYLGTNVLEL